jgi:hypothetical protein
MLLNVFVLALSLWGATVQDEPFDFSCRTFHPFLTERELVARYGSDNVSRGPVFATDDGPSEGTILFASQDGRRVEIIWHDVAARRNPSSVWVRGARSQWRTLNGIALGDDLLTIERRNGFPFRLAGFSSERQGALLDWGKGRLRTTPNCNAGISFQPRTTTEDPSLLRQVTSLPQVSSGHPAMQKINPKVVALWITYFPPQSPKNADDAILDVLVFGTHMPIDPAQYASDLRAAVERYLRRAAAYTPKRSVPSSGEMRMVYSAQVRYETRLFAITDDPNAAAIAQDYVTRLRPCYEWEGFHDCPERDARFADEYQATHPNGPLRHYLPLLAAHRWLCAAEAYDSEGNTQEAEQSRRLYEQRLPIARKSEDLLVRTAAERLAARRQCIAR